MNFTEVKRGYDPEEVDDYIASLDSVIRSYKEKDNAIKNAIISAQVAADNMIKNAKLQADEYKSQIVRELENARDEIVRERFKIQEFQELYAGLVRKYLLKLDEQDTSKLYTCLNEIDKVIDRLMKTDLMPASPGDSSTPAIEFKAPQKASNRRPRTEPNVNIPHL